MANENKQGQGTGGRMGKDAGRKPFGGSGGGNESTRPGLEQEDEGSDMGYDIDVEPTTRKDASPETWRERPLGSSHKPQK
jgi:hypothetical protein